MQIFNTLTNRKETLETITPGQIGIYVCGPTVYNYIHIGNARPVCVFDVLRRFLLYRGYQVKYIQNFTDVNDKIIRQAVQEQSTPEAVAEKYIREYQKDADGLHVMPVTEAPKVSEYIPEIIQFIQVLVHNGYAYAASGDVYFRTRKFQEYGKLSNQSLDDLIAGARVEINDLKEDALDFALWKGCDAAEQHWDSPWGAGRPGWHIECSCMAKHCLGDTIDLHCGGHDLIFPHHENEIAQSEAANGVPFSHYWMHNGHIFINHEKMSKSAGNFLLVRDVAAQYGYEVIRYLMIQAQYRAPMNYSVELLEACRASLDRLYQCRDTVSRAAAVASEGEITSQAQECFDRSREAFIQSLEDDLNTADALSAVFALVRDLNIMAADSHTSRKQLQTGLAVFRELTGVLGLLYERPEADAQDIPEEILALAEKRAAARKEKHFAEADRIREQIQALGYAIKETRQGVEIRKLS